MLFNKKFASKVATQPKVSNCIQVSQKSPNCILFLTHFSSFTNSTAMPIFE